MVSENAVKATRAASHQLPPGDREMKTEVPGDVNLMLRLLVEEYARMGWRLEHIMHLACDPGYQAFHGLYRFFGEVELRRRVGEILQQCGVLGGKSKEVELPELALRIEVTAKFPDARR